MHGKRKKQEEYIEEVAKLNCNIQVIDKYININTPILHKCKICDCEFKRSPRAMKHKTSKCPVCSGKVIGGAPQYKNSIWDSEYKDLFAKYMTEDQMKQYMPHSQHKIKITCENCGRVHETSIGNLSYKRFFSCYCDDGKSYPNKFMYAMLDQLEIVYLPEYSPAWANKKKYDIYIPSLNCIIENHGEQHYKDKTTFKTTLKQQKDNDNYKKNLAAINNIDKYITIDCRKSNADFIKNSIMNSELKNILHLENVNWTQCNNFATSSMSKKAIDLWNDGLSCSQIQELLNITQPTLRTYLKNGNKMGLCNYSTSQSYSRAFSGEKSPRSQMVYCVELNKVFKTVTEASIFTTANAGPISLCCRHMRKSAGGYTWYYLNDCVDKNGDIINGAISLGIIEDPNEKNNRM